MSMDVSSLVSSTAERHETRSLPGLGVQTDWNRLASVMEEAGRLRGIKQKHGANVLHSNQQVCPEDWESVKQRQLLSHFKPGTATGPVCTLTTIPPFH